LFDHSGEPPVLDIGLETKGMESEILEVVRQRGSRRNYVFSSALPEVVMELRARSAVIPVGFICQRSSQLASWRELPADYVMVHCPLITRKLIRLIHQSARKILAWTVNDQNTMTRMAGWGVDGIISNDPQLLARTLG
jgi:glycerophosphoryl diester phosphodiesterase